MSIHARAEALSAVRSSYAHVHREVEAGTLHHVESLSMGRSFPVLLFLPTSIAGEKRESLPLVFLLHGRNHLEVNEQGLRQMYGTCRLQEISDFFQVIMVAPIVGNTGYLDSSIVANSNFGTFLAQELPQDIDVHLRRTSTREQRILCGFSMGGYGAISALCRAPETFSIALARGAVCDYATGVLDLGWDDAALADEFLGSYWKNQESYAEHSCLRLVENLRDRQDVRMVLEVGTEDFLLKTNRKMHARLEEIGIPHVYAEVPGGHEFGPKVLISLLTALRDWPSPPSQL